MRLTLCLVIFSLLSGLPLRAADVGDIQIVTSSFKPYSYIKDGKPAGLSVLRVQKLLDHLDVKPPIHVRTWKWAYGKAMSEPNILIFSMLRTPQREDHFHWVGEVEQVDAWLFGRQKDQDLTMTTLSDGRHYRIGTIERDAKGKYLTGQGLPVSFFSNQKAGVKQVLSGRIDLMTADRNSVLMTLEELQLPANSLKPVFRLDPVSRPVWLAFSKESDPALVERFRHAFQATGRPD